MATTGDPPRQSAGRLTEDELLSALPRRSANREVRVGLFVLVGITAFLAAIFTFTDVGTFRGRYYLTTEIENAGGMRRGDPVQMRGVNIGRVVQFRMVPGGVQVRMELYNEYRVPEGSVALVTSSGLLGGMMVNIAPGASDEPLEDGATIPGRSDQGIMSQAEVLGARADTVLNRAANLLSPQTTSAVNQSALEMQATLIELRALATQQRQDLAALSASLRRSAGSTERATAEVERLAASGELQRSIRSIDSLTARLDRTSASLNAATTSLNTVLGRVERGEGTLGRLSRDESLYTNLNEAASSLNQLVADIRANPKKYLSVSVF